MELEKFITIIRIRYCAVDKQVGRERDIKSEFVQGVTRHRFLIARDILCCDLCQQWSEYKMVGLDDSYRVSSFNYCQVGPYNVDVEFTT